MTDNNNQFTDLQPGVRIKLPARGNWGASVHIPSEDECLAAGAAFAAGRPLLVRGEPGTGKTQLARALAEHNQWALVHRVINGRTELEDLFWHFDAVDRLGEAQCLGDTAPDERKEQLEPKRFLTPGPLWWAFDWSSADTQYKQARHPRGRPSWVEDSGTPKGTVLLIDEIDKADLDLPNGLLEAFGQNGFDVPWLETATVKRGSNPLLIVVTTNEDRELPRAFMRRCLVLNLAYPTDEADADSDRAGFISWFERRGRAHFPQCDSEVLRAAALQVYEDRQSKAGMFPPGLAEYLDLLRMLTHLYGEDTEQQLAQLRRLSRFVCSKGGDR